MTEFVGISDDIVADIAVGLLISFFFIIGNIAAPDTITLALPGQALAVSDELGFSVLTIVVAPVLEEVGFRGVAFFALSVISAPVAIIGQALLFALYHFAGFGEGAPGAFFGALLFGIVAMVVARERDSLLPAIVMHAVFNTWLWTTKFVFVAV